MRCAGEPAPSNLEFLRIRLRHARMLGTNPLRPPTASLVVAITNPPPSFVPQEYSPHSLRSQGEITSSCRPPCETSLLLSLLAASLVLLSPTPLPPSYLRSTPPIRCAHRVRSPQAAARPAKPRCCYYRSPPASLLLSPTPSLLRTSGVLPPFAALTG